MILDFVKYKDKLIEILLGEDYHDKFIRIIEDLHKQGNTKKEIYELFLDLHNEIQVNSLTKDNEIAYDNLSNFMDGFTSFGKGYKILSNESDL